MLTLEQRAQFLKTVPFFANLTADQLNIVAEICEEMNVGTNEYVVREGEPGDAMFTIVQGRVAIQKAVKQSTDSVVRLKTYGPCESFAEPSIFDDQPHPADALALEPTSLLVIRDGPIQALVRRQPDLALDLLRALSHRMYELHSEIAKQMTPKPKKLLQLYDKL